MELAWETSLAEHLLAGSPEKIGFELFCFTRRTLQRQKFSTKQTRLNRHTCTENKTRTYDKEIFPFFSVAYVDQFLLNQETVITLQSILITGYFSELRWMTIISARMISGDFFYVLNTLRWWGGCLWSQEARGKGWERLRVPCVVVFVVNQLITISTFLTHQQY